MGLFGGPPSSSPMPGPTGPSTATQAKGVLPGARANAVARAGGGISPEFLAGLVSQQSGNPGSGLEILGDIRSSLGP